MIMKLTSVLPLLLTCSYALLIPSLNRVESVSSISQESNVPSSPENEFVSIYNRSNQTVSTEDYEPQQYIVVYEDGHKKSEYKAHNEWITEQYSALKKRGEFENLPEGVEEDVTFYNLLDFKGYAAYLPPTLLEEVKADPLVAFVEEDFIVKVSGVEIQSNSPWGSSRISQRNVSNPASKYLYSSEAGSGVTAYVIDTGIKIEHPDFEGRASWGKSIPAPQTEADEQGHGSYVAGTIGGKTYGVAKKVNLVAVRVLDSSGSGRVSDVIKGIQYSVKDHQAKIAAKQPGYKGATINMSLSSGVSNALDQAVNSAVEAGVHVIVSAGNNNQNACNESPARSSRSITVGATNENDQKAGFSNWGECVDIQAPGVNILTVGISRDTEVMSGTSMSAPHVTGLVSYFLSLQPGLGSEFSAGKLVTPDDLKRKLIRFGTHDAISGLKEGTPNVFAYNGAGKDLSEFWAL